jgi:peptidyl-prolyl cis-trans isomerase SurA
MIKIVLKNSLHVFSRWLGVSLLATGLFVTSGPLSTPSSQAQETLKIAAVVNDDVISAFDLSARTMLIIVLSKLPRNQQTVERLEPQVLRMLIDEKLKLQEAERLGIQVSQQELESTLAHIEKSNKFAPGKLISTLESLGIGIDSLLSEAKSNIAWSQIIPKKYGSNVEVTDEDITAALNEATERQNQPQYLLSEIVLPFDNPSKSLEVRKQAQQLIQELKNGAKFDSLARAFSQAPSAPNGGAGDWIRLDQLPEALAQVVRTMRPGQISTEISLPAAYVILNLRKARAGGAPKQADVVVDLNQFHLGLPADATTSSVDSYMQTAKGKTQGTKSCKEFSGVAKEFGSPLSGPIGKVALSKLPAHLSNTVAAMAVNTPSQPIRTDDAVIVLMVCERIEPQALSNEEKRVRIKRQIFGQRIAVYARQAMRDLRRAAYIDIR